MPVSIFPEVAFHRITLIARAGDLPVEQTADRGHPAARERDDRRAGRGDHPLADDARRRPARPASSAGQRHGRGAAAGAGGDRNRRADACRRTREFEARLLDTSAFPIVGIAVTSDAARPRPSSPISSSTRSRRSCAPSPASTASTSTARRCASTRVTVDPAALAAHRLDLGAVESAVRTPTSTIAAAGQVRRRPRAYAGRGARPGRRRRTLLGDLVVARRNGAACRSRRQSRRSSRACARTSPAPPPNGRPRRADRRLAPARRQRRRHLRPACASASRRSRTRIPSSSSRVVYDQADLVHECDRQRARQHRHRPAAGRGAPCSSSSPTCARPLVAAAVIPATVLISCIVLRALDMSFNLMTLGGIAAGIGLILDDAIVVIENVHRHRALGHRRRRGLRGSLGEITHALLGSTLTPVAVLLPLGAAQRRAGRVLPAAGDHHVGRAAGLARAGPDLHAGAGRRRRAARPRPACGMGRRSPRRVARHASTRAASRWTLRHRVAGAGDRRRSWCAVACAAYDHVDTGFVPAWTRAPSCSTTGRRPARRSPRPSACCGGSTPILRQTPGGGRRSPAAPARSWASFSPRPTAATTPCACDAARERGIEAVMDEVRDQHRRAGAGTARRVRAGACRT